MKLIIELSTEDAVAVLNQLDLDEIVMTTTDGSATNVAKPKRKRRTKAEIEADEKAAKERETAVSIAEELSNEAAELATEANEELKVNVNDSADTLGESFTASTKAASPWAS